MDVLKELLNKATEGIEALIAGVAGGRYSRREIDLYVLIATVAIVGLLLIVLRRRARRPAKPECTFAPSEPSSVQVAAVADDETAEEEIAEEDLWQSASNTLIGRVAFRDQHQVGRLGDELCHLYLQRNGKRGIYRQLRSKRTKVHGFDAVYLRTPQRGAGSVIVIENKVNTSKYKRNQISNEGIAQQCERMLASGLPELADTASKILAALQGRGPYVLERLLLRHNLVTGRSTRTIVDAHGERVRGSRRSVDMSRQLRARLEKRVATGKYKLIVVEPGEGKAGRAAGGVAAKGGEVEYEAAGLRGVRQQNGDRTTGGIESRPDRLAVGLTAADGTSVGGVRGESGRGSEASVGDAGPGRLPARGSVSPFSRMSVRLDPILQPGDSFLLSMTDKGRLEAALAGEFNSFRWQRERLTAEIQDAERHLEREPSCAEAKEAIRRLKEELRIVSQKERALQQRDLEVYRSYLEVSVGSRSGRWRELVIGRMVRVYFDAGPTIIRQSQRFSIMESTQPRTRCLQVFVTSDRTVDFKIVGRDLL